MPVPQRAALRVFDANPNRRCHQIRWEIAGDCRCGRDRWKPRAPDTGCRHVAVLDRTACLVSLAEAGVASSRGAGPTGISAVARGQCPGPGDCRGCDVRLHDNVLGLLEHLLQTLAARGADLAIDFLAIDKHHEARNLVDVELLRQFESRVVSISRIG